MLGRSSLPPKKVGRSSLPVLLVAGLSRKIQGVLGGAFRGGFCFARARGRALAHKARWGGLPDEVALLLKTVPKSTLVGSSALENATIPPQKYALAKEQQGQKNRPKKA